MKYLRGPLPRGLRQEFRELEMLNEITRLRCSGALHKDVKGKTRQQLIKTYQRVYKNPPSSKDVHKSIAWRQGETLDPTRDNEKWKYEADKNLVKRDAFKWTILRPGGLTNAPGTGTASIGRTHLTVPISVRAFISLSCT